MTILTNVINIKELANILPGIKKVYVLTHYEEDIIKDPGIDTIWIPLFADNADYNPEFIKEVELIVLEPGYKDSLILMALSGFCTVIPVQFVYEKDNKLYLNENTHRNLVGIQTAILPYLKGCILLAIKLLRNEINSNNNSYKAFTTFYENFDDINKEWKVLEEEINKLGQKLVEEKLSQYF